MTPTVESIWNEVASQLRSFIRSRVRDHSAAEDILQEVFIRIHGKLPSLRANEKVEAWVWRITRNGIADYFRKLKPSEPLPADLRQAEDSPAVPDLRPCVQRFLGELDP